MAIRRRIKFSWLGFLLQNMKRIIASVSIVSAIGFTKLPRTTVLCLGGLVSSLAGYYLYNRWHNIHIVLRREYGHWSILFMRQGQPVQGLQNGLLIRSIGLHGEPFRDATLLLFHYSPTEGAYGAILNKVIGGVRIGGPVHLTH